jgi:hypothetical protein
MMICRTLFELVRVTADAKAFKPLRENVIKLQARWILFARVNICTVQNKTCQAFHFEAAHPTISLLRAALLTNLR